MDLPKKYSKNFKDWTGDNLEQQQTDYLNDLFNAALGHPNKGRFSEYPRSSPYAGGADIDWKGIAARKAARKGPMHRDLKMLMQRHKDALFDQLMDQQLQNGYIPL